MNTYEKLYESAKLKESIDKDYWEKYALDWVEETYADKNFYSEAELDIARDAAVGAVLAAMRLNSSYDDDWRQTGEMGG